MSTPRSGEPVRPLHALFARVPRTYDLCNRLLNPAVNNSWDAQLAGSSVWFGYSYFLYWLRAVGSAP